MESDHYKQDLFEFDERKIPEFGVRSKEDNIKLIKSLFKERRLNYANSYLIGSYKHYCLFSVDFNLARIDLKKRTIEVCRNYFSFSNCLFSSDGSCLITSSSDSLHYWKKDDKTFLKIAKKKYLIGAVRTGDGKIHPFLFRSLALARNLSFIPEIRLSLFSLLDLDLKEKEKIIFPELLDFHIDTSLAFLKAYFESSKVSLDVSSLRLDFDFKNEISCKIFDTERQTKIGQIDATPFLVDSEKKTIFYYHIKDSRLVLNIETKDKQLKATKTSAVGLIKEEPFVVSQEKIQDLKTFDSARKVRVFDGEKILTCHLLDKDSKSYLLYKNRILAIFDRLKNEYYINYAYKFQDHCLLTVFHKDCTKLISNKYRNLKNLITRFEKDNTLFNFSALAFNLIRQHQVYVTDIVEKSNYYLLKIESFDRKKEFSFKIKRAKEASNLELEYLTQNFYLCINNSESDKALSVIYKLFEGKDRLQLVSFTLKNLGVDVLRVKNLRSKEGVLKILEKEFNKQIIKRKKRLL